MHDKHTSPADSISRLLHRVRALRVHRRFREKTQTFVIEGVRQFIRACDAAYALDTIVHSPILLRHSGAERLVRHLARSSVQRLTLTPEQFRSISSAQHASGILAIAKQRWRVLDEMEPHRGLGWLVIERLRSPGHLGTILRTAEAVGMSGAIFVGPDCSDPYDPQAVHASMGGIFNLPLIRTRAREFSFWLAHHDIAAVALAPRAQRLWTELPGGKGCALLLGEERHGLSPTLLRLADHEIRLPMSGRADSLNVAVAAGVVMYELRRRAMTDSCCS